MPSRATGKQLASLLCPGHKGMPLQTTRASANGVHVRNLRWRGEEWLMATKREQCSRLFCSYIKGPSSEKPDNTVCTSCSVLA